MMPLCKSYSLIVSLLLLQSASCLILESVDGVSEASQQKLSIHIPKEVRDAGKDGASITVTVADSDESDIVPGSGGDQTDDTEDMEGELYFSVFHPSLVPQKVQIWAMKTTQTTLNKSICFKNIDSDTPIRISIFSDSPKEKKVTVTIVKGRENVCENLGNTTCFIDINDNTDADNDMMVGGVNTGLIVVVILLLLVVLVLGGREMYRWYNNYTINKRIEGDEEQRKSKPIFRGKTFPLKVEDVEKGENSILMETKLTEKVKDQETINAEKVKANETKPEEKIKEGEHGKIEKNDIKEEEEVEDEENGEREEDEMKDRKTKKYGNLGTDFPEHFNSKQVQKKF